MSDASEVKRYFIETVIGNSCVVYEERVDGLDNYTEMVTASDHDRIMAERDELWKRATKFVMPGEMDTGESIEHYIKTLEQTIATQARVIELCKKAFEHHEYLSDAKFEYMENCLREIAAIEKEGAKDVE